MSLLGKMVREEIKKVGLTHKQVAKHLGIDRTTLSKYINGHLPFPDDIRDKLLDYLKSPRLRILVKGTTSTNIIFNKVKIEFYVTAMKTIQEHKEAIEAIENVLNFAYNINSTNDMTEKQLQQFNYMLDQNEDSNHACDMLDIAAHELGADLKARNERCLKKYIDRGYIENDSGTHLPMSTAHA